MDLRVVVLTGASGSGKTELALNLAKRFRNKLPGGAPVTLVDLDLNTPLFRSREQGQFLESWSVSLVKPTTDSGAGLPLLPPRLDAVFSAGQGAVIMDVGGGEKGTRVLRGLTERMQRFDPAHYSVVNPRRPQTATVDSIVRATGEMEGISGLPLTGVVSNPNLGEATSAEEVCIDHQLVVAAAAELELPVRWLSVLARLVDEVRRMCADSLETTILPIRRWMLPFWERDDGGDRP